MINYKKIEVKRLIDKKSTSHPNLFDKIRSFFIRKKKGLTCGKTTLFKENVKIGISDNGLLKIGEYCVIQKGTTFLLTLPKPNVEIGNHVYIGKDTIIASKNNIKIGDFTIFAPRCYVIESRMG